MDLQNYSTGKNSYLKIPGKKLAAEYNLQAQFLKTQEGLVEFLMRQQLFQDERIQKKQAENHQNKPLVTLAMLSKGQVNQHVDTTLEPKEDSLLSKKVKANVIKQKRLLC